jgi:hypothetical protein
MKLYFKLIELLIVIILEMAFIFGSLLSILEFGSFC